MEELKPCPFCGGEAEIVGGPENWTPTFYDPDSGGDPIAVVCKTCACGLHFFDGYAEAASAWNRRTGNDTNVATNNAVPVVRGEWINTYADDEGIGDFVKHCSVCCNAIIKSLSASLNFCPNCGAKMEVEPCVN